MKAYTTAPDIRKYYHAYCCSCCLLLSTFKTSGHYAAVQRADLF